MLAVAVHSILVGVVPLVTGTSLRVRVVPLIIEASWLPTLGCHMSQSPTVVALYVRLRSISVLRDT